MTTITLLYLTCPDRDTARRMAASLLEARLVACCNLFAETESHYWWEGAKTTASEVVMLCKTTPAQAAAAMEKIAALHPYECPAILAIPTDAYGPFAAWIAAETKMNEKG